MKWLGHILREGASTIIYSRLEWESGYTRMVDPDQNDSKKWKTWRGLELPTGDRKQKRGITNCT